MSLPACWRELDREPLLAVAEAMFEELVELRTERRRLLSQRARLAAELGDVKRDRDELRERLRRRPIY